MKKTTQLLLIIALVIGLMPLVLALESSSIKTKSQCTQDMSLCRGYFFDLYDGGVNAGKTYKFVGATEVNPGWNIMSLSAYDELYSKFEAAGKKNLIKGMFLYNPVNSQYYSASEMSGTMNTEKKTALESYTDEMGNMQMASVWVYLDAEYRTSGLIPGGNFYFSMDFLGNRDNPDWSFPMYKGWNFVTIMPDMVITESGEASRIFGDNFQDCTVLKAYKFNSNTQQWDNVMSSSFDVFKAELPGESVGESLIIKVADNCVGTPLSGNSENTLVAPALPN